MLAVIALVILIVTGVTWLYWRSTEIGTYEKVASLAEDALSIVVLPRDNLSDDPAQDYFADGLTEDITTDLSKLSGLFVIARNSASTYAA